MAGLIRAHQWRVTTLGSSERWPIALKTAVELILQSRQPAYVCWGRALSMIYNDAAIALIGPRHPGAMGAPCADVFSDNWADMRPVIEAVMAGEPQHVVGQKIGQAGNAEPASWHTFSWTPLRDDGGKIAGFVCAATETTLQLDDGQLRTVIENTSDGISMLDLHSGKYAFMSPSHAILTGFTSDEMRDFTAEDFYARVHPDDKDAARHPDVYPDNQLFDSAAEYRWRVKSGEYRWFGVNRKVVYDPAGTPVALVNVVRDITDRKRADMENRISRANLEAALSSMTDAIFFTDRQGRLLHVNDAFASFHRYHGVKAHPDNFADIAKDFEVFFPDGTYAPLEGRPMARALRGEVGVGAEYTLRRIDTGESWIGSYSFGPIRSDDGAITGAVVTARDVTQAKKDVEALRISEERLALAVESAETGTWEWDVQTDRAVWNAKLYELLGLPPKPAEVGGTFFERVHPDDLPGMLEELRTVIDSGRDWRDEFRIVRPDGSIRWLVGVGRVYRNPDGSPRAMFGVNYDISHQRQAEADLRRSETRYRLLHETQRDGLVQVDMNGTILDCNANFCDMLGYSAEEIRRQNYRDLTPSRWHDLQDTIMADQIVPRGYSDVFEKEYRRKDGMIIPVELRTILERDDTGEPSSMWAVVRDLTERKANEARILALKEELMHVARVNELSQVSAGIAHELNQPLAAMLNYSTTAKRMIAKNDTASIAAAATSISKAGEQAQRAGDIIRRMRDFVERRHTDRKPDDINAIVTEAMALGLIGSKAEGIETELDLAPSLPAVVADRVQIQQVLVNLMHNAIDAMSRAPLRKLTLSTQSCERGIEIAVADTGTGVPLDVAARLFQPFVTSKPDGMGIGLAISRSIIEAHGGVIGFDSNSGCGTVFRFTLPTGMQH